MTVNIGLLESRWGTKLVKHIIQLEIVIAHTPETHSGSGEAELLSVDICLLFNSQHTILPMNECTKYM